ncbi:ferritin-like domain-containing protein [bacterium]|nr:ferritin-like domain-containing protein [bacterium]
MSDVMPEKVKAMFLIFKKAVEAERGAQKMYLEALDQTDDPFLKKILTGFYKDEVRHENELMEQYKLLRDKYSE